MRERRIGQFARVLLLNNLLELFTLHGLFPQSTCLLFFQYSSTLFAAYPASLALASWRSCRAMSRKVSCSSSRNLMRALCNCDFEFPIEHSINLAISLCSYPCTSCSTNTCL